MKADCLILQICDFLDDGDGFYRIHEPSRQLSRLPGVVAIDCHFYHRLLPGLIQAADIVILPFIHDWDFFGVIEQRRASGKITIFEANDLFEDVQPWNPVSSGWQDRSIQEEYLHFMSAADAVQTSTHELGRRWRGYARNIAVFENQLADIPSLPAEKSFGLPTALAEEVGTSPLVIGWGGSPGHFADWYYFAPTIQKWLARNPSVHLRIMTNEFARPFIKLPSDRYHFVPFGSLADYYRFVTTLDIGLAPLLPTDYNRCRSDVKFLEYAARGVAGIYADLEPYRGTVVHGETGLLFGTPTDLEACLDRLANDRELLLKIRSQSYQYVTRERRIQAHVGERWSFYRSLMPCQPAGCELPAEIVAAARRDGDYLQLRPQQPEQTLLEVLRKPVTQDAKKTLINLMEHFPEYQPALQQLGRICNDLGDWKGALYYLEKAQQLNPGSARLLCEIGRAQFRQGGAGKARQSIEKALAINPLYLPGWQYLLRLLAVCEAGDGQAWAERARTLFPRNYLLALASASLFPSADALPFLRRLLEDYALHFKAEELPAAGAAFAQAVREAVKVSSSCADLLALLQHGCKTFPRSASFADLLARTFRETGSHDESQDYYLHALEVQRAAMTYKNEFSQEDGSLHYWQIAGQIHKWISVDQALTEDAQKNR